MRWNNLDQEPCPVARSLSVLGDRWTLMIVRDSLFGVRRFEGFQASLKISRTTLRDRLAQLVDHGVLERRPYQENPVRHDYMLTAKGRGLSDVMLVLANWGNQHLSDDGGSLVQNVHKTCGHTFVPVVSCSHCGEAVSGSVITSQVAALKTASAMAHGSTNVR